MKVRALTPGRSARRRLRRCIRMRPKVESAALSRERERHGPDRAPAYARRSSISAVSAAPLGPTQTPAFRRRPALRFPTTRGRAHFCSRGTPAEPTRHQISTENERSCSPAAAWPTPSGPKPGALESRCTRKRSEGSNPPAPLFKLSRCTPKGARGRKWPPTSRRTVGATPRAQRSAAAYRRPSSSPRVSKASRDRSRREAAPREAASVPRRLSWGAPRSRAAG
jgi:hypothetical protein